MNSPKNFYTAAQTAKIESVFAKFFYADEIQINQETGVIKAMWRGDWIEHGKNRCINIYHSPNVKILPILENSRFWDFSKEELKSKSYFFEALDNQLSRIKSKK